MKIVTLLMYFGTAFTYNANSQKSAPMNLFEPAQIYQSRLAMSEGSDPMRTNQGVFFQPVTIWPKLGSGVDHLHDQVLNSQREKRDAEGELHIMTNHALPIHADVKSDGTTVVEKVTAPDDTIYELKSLRKSWPLPNKLELVRSITRVVTLAVLLISAVVEFFPLLKSLCSAVYSFIYL